MNRAAYDHTANGIQIMKGEELYDIHIDGMRMSGTFGPDVVNALIRGEDTYKQSISRSLPPGMSFEQFLRRLRTFPQVPEPG